jgi:hypothetical protein
MLFVDVVRFLLPRWSLLRALSVFVALVAVNGNSLAGQLSLAWDPVANATGYKLYYGTATRSYSSNVDAKNVTNYTVAGLTNGVRYYFAVQAYNATVTSDYSSEANAVVPTSTTAAPVASFTASPTTGTAPMAVTFPSSSISCSSGTRQSHDRSERFTGRTGYELTVWVRRAAAPSGRRTRRSAAALP